MLGGGGMAEHDDRTVAGGGGIAEHDDSAVVGGGGIAEHDDSAVVGGGGMAEQDDRTVAGGGGMNDPERVGRLPVGHAYGPAGIDIRPSSSPRSASAPNSIQLMVRR
jgi:hypothetical protein